MKTGTRIDYDGSNARQEFAWCVENGLPTCQLYIPLELGGKEHIGSIRAARSETGIEISALISLWRQPRVWDFYEGPVTLGIVPAAYQDSRMRELLEYAVMAEKLGVESVCSHMGFIPENPYDPLYMPFISACRWLAGAYGEHGIGLNFETGQETPTTLLRAVRDIGADNVGINYDPANLLMYGKANPVDALSILGPLVRGVHVKDGEYPGDCYELGAEKRVGEGSVNFPLFIEKLKACGYDGALTIEREITGPELKPDILSANRFLKTLI